MNQKAAELNNERLHNEAVRSEIHAVLSKEGPLHCGAVARRLDIDSWECREHLEAMTERGEIQCKLWRYSV